MVARRKGQSLLTTSAPYRIRVMGRIDIKWSDYFQGLNIAQVTDDNESGAVFTELSGQLPDQAALMGVLWQLYTWGVSLISVSCNELDVNLEDAALSNNRLGNHTNFKK